MSKHVALVGGGLDSVVLAHFLKAEFDCDLHVVTIDHVHKSIPSMWCARETAKRLDAEHTIFNVNPSCYDRKHTALSVFDVSLMANFTSAIISLGYGVAATCGGSSLALGATKDDAVSAKMLGAIAEAHKTALRGRADPYLRLRTPFGTKTKAEVIEIGDELGVPFYETWSCVEYGAETHCGTCGGCKERRAGFEEAGVADPTEYVWDGVPSVDRRDG